MVRTLEIKKKEKVLYFSEMEVDFRGGSRRTKYGAMGSGTGQMVPNKRANSS